LIMRTNVHAKDMSGRKCNKCLDESIWERRKTNIA
jgi:hypothetical protein